MPRIFQLEYTVRPEDIDPQGHANNVAYFDWLQQAAVAHSAANGWSGEAYRERGWAWVVRTHFIEYRRPAFAEDCLIVNTWVADMKKYTSLRKYRIYRGSDLVARAETNWAFVETSQARLTPIPELVASAFEVVSEQDPEFPPGQAS